MRLGFLGRAGPPDDHFWFLLAKLKSAGIDGAVLNLIISYGGVLSEEAACQSGVPQGLLIGALPLLLYI